MNIRIHTGQYDEHGELCTTLMNVTIKPADKKRPGIVKILGPKGNPLFIVPRKKIDIVSLKDIASDLSHEARIQKLQSKRGEN